MKNIKFLCLMGTAILLWLIPMVYPSFLMGLNPQAYHLFLILLTTVISFALFDLNIGMVTFFGLVALLVTQTLSLTEVLGGFSNKQVWLIVSTYFMADAVFDTGLGHRISLWILSKIGYGPKTLAYGLSLSGLVLSMGIPSTIARANGLVYPIMSSICTNLGSSPKDKPERIGKYLFMSYMNSEVYIGYAFLTSCGLNVILAQYAHDLAGIEITWAMWALCALPIILISFAVVPLMTYKLVTPTIDNCQLIRSNSLKMYEDLGPVTIQQKLLMGIIGVTICFWVACDYLGWATAYVSLISVGVMLSCKLLTWDKVIGNKMAWNTLIWLGTLICMANHLVTKGFISWASASISPLTAGFNWIAVFVIVVLIYNYTQYFFASTTAHAVTMFAICLTALFAAHVPTMLAILIIAFTTGTSAMITPYSSGQNPLFFNVGYFTNNEWWRIGFITSWFFVLSVMIIGPVWWKVLGLW